MQWDMENESTRTPNLFAKHILTVAAPENSKSICQVFSRNGYRMRKAGLKHHETKTSLYRRGTWLCVSSKHFCIFLQPALLHICPILKVGRGHIHLQRMWAWICASFGSFGGLWALSIWPVRQRAREPFLQSLSSWWVPRRKRWTWLQEVPRRHRYSTVRLSIHIRLRVPWRIHQHCSKRYTVRSLWGRAGLSVLIKAWASHHRTSCLEQKCRSQDSMLGYVVVCFRVSIGTENETQKHHVDPCRSYVYTFSHNPEPSPVLRLLWILHIKKVLAWMSRICSQSRTV